MKSSDVFERLDAFSDAGQVYSMPMNQKCPNILHHNVVQLRPKAFCPPLLRVGTIHIVSSSLHMLPYFGGPALSATFVKAFVESVLKYVHRLIELIALAKG